MNSGIAPIASICACGFPFLEWGEEDRAAYLKWMIETRSKQSSVIQRERERERERDM
jgi:hypothetical protein